jgi:hypothetical protein
MASALNDLTLNILAAIIVSVIIATNTRRDYIVLAFIIYSVFLVISFFVPGGGQLNAAIAVSAILYALFSWTTEDLIKAKPTDFVSQFERVPIFEGYVLLNETQNKIFDTYNPKDPLYRRLSLSQNRMGGAQFSYSFWIQLGGAMDLSLSGRTIFVRGDNRKFRPQIKRDETPNFVPYFVNASGDITIACPRIYFKTHNSIGVQVNTDKELLFETEVGNNYMDSEVRKNALSLIPGTWAMITLVVEDNFPINDFENGVAIKVFLNDTMYSTATVEGSLRPNTGPIHFLPSDSSSNTPTWPAKSKISDLIYYNYALNENEVKRIYYRGPNKTASKDLDSTSSRKNNDTLMLGDVNKLDITNYSAELDPVTI